MKRLLPLLLLLLTSCSVQAQDASVAAEGVDWHPSFRAALTAAEQSGRKVIVDIYAPWCGWCRRLQREVYSDAAVQAYVRAHFEIVRINGEEGGDKHQYMGYELSSTELAQGLGAQGYPTTVFLGPDGKYLTRLPGFSAAGDFLRVLRYMGTDSYKTQSFAEYSGQKGEGEE